MSSVDALTAPTVASGTDKVNASALDAQLALIVTAVNQIISALNVAFGDNNTLRDDHVRLRMLAASTTAVISETITSLADLRQQIGQGNVDTTQQRTNNAPLPSSYTRNLTGVGATVDDTSDNLRGGTSVDREQALVVPGVAGRLYRIRLRVRANMEGNYFGNADNDPSNTGAPHFRYTQAVATTHRFLTTLARRIASPVGIDFPGQINEPRTGDAVHLSRLRVSYSPEQEMWTQDFGNGLHVKASSPFRMWVLNGALSKGGSPNTEQDLLRFDYLAIDSATGEQVLVNEPAAAGAYHILKTPDSLFALSNTGRFIWRSLDGGYSWEVHDFGSTCFTFSSYLHVAPVLVGSVETFLVVQPNSVNACFITAEWPPTRTTFTCPIPYTHSAVAGYDGEPMLIGESAPNTPRASRYVGGSWQTVPLPTTDSGTASMLVKTPTGTYIASCWRSGVYTQWIRTSVDFSSWSSRIDVRTRVTNGDGIVWLLDGGRVLRIVHDESAAFIVILYSDTDGATWVPATHPAISGPANDRGCVKGEDDAWYCANGEGVVLRSEDNGSAWSVFSNLGADPGFIRGPVLYTAPADDWTEQAPFTEDDYAAWPRLAPKTQDLILDVLARGGSEVFIEQHAGLANADGSYASIRTDDYPLDDDARFPYAYRFRAGGAVQWDLLGYWPVDENAGETIDDEYGVPIHAVGPGGTLTP